MELILKTNNENSIAKIIALAKKLDILIEQRDKVVEDKNEKEELKTHHEFQGKRTIVFWRCGRMGTE